MVRHHILHFPNDTTAVKQQQQVCVCDRFVNVYLLHTLQYMFGESLLVAPVVTKDVREWSVYLPAGETWLDVGSTFQASLSYHT